MSLLDWLFPKEKGPETEPIAFPLGYHREGDDQIIVEPAYTARWVAQYGDSVVAVGKMLAFLKSQYPEVTRFRVKKA